MALLVLVSTVTAYAQAPAVTGGPGFGTPTLVAAPVLAGQPLAFAGTLGSSAARSTVNIQVLAPDVSWHTVATATTDETGAFETAWRSAPVGRFSTRGVLAGPAVAASTAPLVTTTATVFRGAVATWYDMQGKTGACGVPITKRTLGIAHKSLPCGTKVDISYGGRTITVPVIDRGPYARGVSYDLTLAAAKALDVVSLGRAHVGVLPERERTPAPQVLANLFGGVSLG